MLDANFKFLAVFCVPTSLCSHPMNLLEFYFQILIPVKMVIDYDTNLVMNVAFMIHKVLVVFFQTQLPMTQQWSKLSGHGL